MLMSTIGAEQKPANGAGKSVQCTTPVAAASVNLCASGADVRLACWARLLVAVSIAITARWHQHRGHADSLQSIAFAVKRISDVDIDERRCFHAVKAMYNISLKRLRRGELLVTHAKCLRAVAFIEYMLYRCNAFLLLMLTFFAPPI